MRSPNMRFIATAVFLTATAAAQAQQSVARQWDEESLNAIRHDLARPPIQARNLFHVSIAMYDGWAMYDRVALPYLTQENHADVTGLGSARDETISFAAYRVLHQRFANSPEAAGTLASFDARMSALGYNGAITTTVGNTPAA